MRSSISLYKSGDNSVMIVFDKQEIRDSLSIDDIYNLLDEWGGEPERCPTGLIARTICHNHLEDEASRKLYYYENTGLFRCYTGCEEPIFDIFQLCIKVMSLQKGLNYDLNDAVRWIAYRFRLSGREENDLITNGLEDWKLLDSHSRIEDIRISTPIIILKEYDKDILSRLNYKVKLKPWLDEGISQEILQFNQIGFYPGGD